jgi:hypothetical protein
MGEDGLFMKRRKKSRAEEVTPHLKGRESDYHFGQKAGSLKKNYFA